jgi:hypothetical protein
MNMQSANRRWMVKGIALVMVGLAVGWISGRARAGGVPAVTPMRFAGTISEQGVPVNGLRDITIVLWDSGVPSSGSILCSTAAGSTSVVQGRFSVPLNDTCTKIIQGSLTTTPVTPNATDIWSEVQVGGVSFGKQKVSAVPFAMMAGAVNGIVTSSAIVPTSAADGSLGRGAGGASIYNDGTAGALVLQGNSAKVVVNDNLSVKTNVTTGGAITAGGDIGTTGNGRINVGVYAREAADVYDLSCLNNDTAIGGGVECHQNYDQMALQSRANLDGTRPYGWHGICMNHDNSSATSAPQKLQVICISRGK